MKRESQYYSEREHMQKYQIFNHWLQDRDFDMEYSTAYSFKSLDFLTCCQQDWDYIQDRGDEDPYLSTENS